MLHENSRRCFTKARNSVFSRIGFLIVSSTCSAGMVGPPSCGYACSMVISSKWLVAELKLHGHCSLTHHGFRSPVQLRHVTLFLAFQLRLHIRAKMPGVLNNRRPETTAPLAVVRQCLFNRCMSRKCVHDCQRITGGLGNAHPTMGTRYDCRVAEQRDTAKIHLRYFQVVNWLE